MVKIYRRKYISFLGADDTLSSGKLDGLVISYSEARLEEDRQTCSIISAQLRMQRLVESLGWKSGPPWPGKIEGLLCYDLEITGERAIEILEKMCPREEKVKIMHIWDAR